MKVQLGNAPISWGVCEIDGWGPQLPYPQVLDELAAAGYAGTELGPWGYLPGEVDALCVELDRRGLALASAFVPLELKDPGRFDVVEQRVRDTASLLQALGARHILLSDAGDARRKAIAGRPEQTKRAGLSPDEWTSYAAALERLARLCRDEYGLVSCFHSHGGTYVENSDEIARLLDSTDAGLVRFCLDTGHVAFGGGDPLAVATTYAERIGYVHIKDIRLDRLRANLSRGEDYTTAAREDVFVELGQGDVDIPAIIDALEKAAYEGWIIVEQDRVARAGVDTLASARVSRAYLETILAR